MKGNNMKKQRKFNIAYLLCLVPILSIAAFAGLLLLPDKFIYLGSVPIWTPIGQQNVSGISVLSVLAVILAALAWGYCGSFAAKKRLGLTASMLTANAIPLISVVLYFVFGIIAAVGKSDLSGTADVFALGFGLFNITGSLIYSLSESYALEIIFDLILILGSFAIGYSIGAAQKKKLK